MRLFQNGGIYNAYYPRLTKLREGHASYSEYMRVFLNDRYGAAHLLEPVLNRDLTAFFTNGDDEAAQRLWAKEQGLPSNTKLDDILLAQIEHHKTEIFYNLDPIRLGGEFLKRLPASVKLSLAWRAAPLHGVDLSGYGGILCNFPSIIRSYEEKGWKGFYFFPAHDPEMDLYASNKERPIDVVFIGGYTRYHKRRSELLDAVARLDGTYSVIYHLDVSRYTKLIESPFGFFLKKHRRSNQIQAISRRSVFGRELYSVLSRAKIVLNGAIDMAGNDRGNMRCFEAMGCRAVLLSDDGIYPSGMMNGVNMVMYNDRVDAVEAIHELLSDEEKLNSLSMSGYNLIREQFSKKNQMALFEKIVEMAI